MTPRAVARQRLLHHRLAADPLATQAEAVGWLGAMQGQEHLSARWAVGLRCAGHDEAAVDRALAEGSVIRTWALRGTLHLIAAADWRWLVGLVGPLAVARHAPAFARLGVEVAAWPQIERDLIQILRGGKTLTRPEVFAELERHGHSTAGQRGYYMLATAGLSSRLCLGPMRGKQETYTLIEEWAPHAQPRPREEALRELARRYFTSHGPATLADFAWWSGLTKADARAGLDGARATLREQAFDGQAHWGPPEAAPDGAPAAYLLPAFDEYVLGYADRSAVLGPEHTPRVLSSNGIFYPTMVHDGQVIGTWKRTLKRATVDIALSPFARLTRTQRRAVAEAAERYGAFLGLKPVLVDGEAAVH